MCVVRSNSAIVDLISKDDDSKNDDGDVNDCSNASITTRQLTNPSDRFITAMGTAVAMGTVAGACEVDDGVVQQPSGDGQS